MIENKSKQRFFSALSDVFLGEVGQKIEGDSGYTNLMAIRNEYFQYIEPIIQQKIEEKIHESQKNELYNKLFTFFESYLNETGCPFYYKTQLHKNLYEKIYSDKEDTTLFWKTQKLYYIKSEKLYTSMKFDINGVNFEFDASEMQLQQNNEKKNIIFILSKIDKKNVIFKVRYKDNNIKKLEEILKLKGSKKVKEYLFNNINTIDNFDIDLRKNYLDLNYFSSKTKFEKLINVFNKKEGLLVRVIIELGLTDLNNIDDYIKKQNINIDIKTIEKAIRIYKKQNEIDFFIHRNAESFLREQFNLYLYNYLINDNYSEWTEERIEEIRNIKDIAFEVIEYISKFEDELKSIWIKPKFVRKSNYVLTLGKLENNIELVEKIINSEGFEKQYEEWKELYERKLDESGREIKKEWKEFQFVNGFDRDSIIENTEQVKKLKNEFKHLPLDTKYFKNLEEEILDSFDNLDKEIDGILVKSDNFQALNTLLFKYKGKVDLIYIDPPFNTGSDFDYKDGYQDSTWLTLMSNKLELAKDYLSDKGSFYLHLDKNANHYGKMLLNQQLDNCGFKNEIIWKKLSSTKSQSTYFSDIIDTIYLYGKEECIFNKVYVKSKNDYKTYNKIEEETGRRYGSFDFTQSGQGEARYFGDRGLLSPPSGKHWIWSQEKINEGLKNNRIIFTSNGTPRVKRYLDEKKGNALGNLWSDNDVKPLSANDYENLGFKTQKPEALLKRIIEVSSNRESLIMDFFAGTGTTISVAHKLRRKWIGIEMGEHFYDIIIPRLKKVLRGDISGISKETRWNGGGFFKYYELEQFEDTLKHSKYNSDEIKNPLIFYNSEKLLDVLKIEDNDASIDFRYLYDDVDITETISNLTGKEIKKYSFNKILFEDGKDIDIDNIKWEDNKNLKPLFWWGE
ncbi:site-specific DNA-methyltransferase [Maledivibacter halophilus]|uniref:Adenine specific DNA methylase Mod n=1 Tax=Maledivibacter halophilus TaxID=36842 RepID=A0A1T5IES4_9FIRM|nr:site-specific DNA-methyltransferase [Maledivibacter halophilus]SKC37691.1 Adenine specific DNA methylase Mod [Maledivibacter halophilus]